MFSRLVSQLSLSPSAASQLTFYARRLGQERVTRKFSAVAAVLVMGLQFATILVPPTPAVASSPSDIIHGGITSRDDLLNRYDDSVQVQHIYKYFGVTRADIEKTKLVTINTLDRSYKSLGRVQHLSSDVPISIDGTTYWQRGLYTWDTGSYIKSGSSYKVYEGKRSLDGGYFAIMVQCGNIVVKTNPAQPKPPAPKPPTPTPVPPTPAPTPKTAKLACTQLKGNLLSGQAPLEVRFTGLGAATGDTIAEWLFDFGDAAVEKKATGSVVHVYQNPGKFIAHLQVKGASGKITDKSSACSFTVDVVAPPAAYEKAKTALNLTQNIDATTRPAAAGDEIKYTLITRNVGAATSSYVVTEHLTDVLEYATVTNSGGGQVDPSTGVISWPGNPIKPKEALVHTFTVKIKSPIPPTPVSVSDRYSYDLRIDNIYGTAVHINVAPPLAKQVESASTSLPATGSPLATFIVLVVSGLTLFFYFRNRQLAAEIKLLRGDFQGGA